MLLSQLKYFRAVASHEHIGHAAEELHIAQPALSATIRKLEKELGTSLFNRTGRHIRLNESGKCLLFYVDFIFSQLDEMEQELLKIEEIWENEFTLAVSNSTYLNGWLQQFVMQNPHIHLRQKILSETQMLAALQEESIDIALGEFGESVPNDITRKKLIEDEYVITIPIDHPLAKKEAIYFQDICNEDIIALSSNAIVRIADRIFALKGCRPNIVFEGNQRMMSKMLRSNRGLLFDSRQMVYLNHLRSRNTKIKSTDIYPIIMQPIADLNCHYCLSLCWKKDRKLPTVAQKFITAMENDYPNYENDLNYQNAKELFLIIN